MLHLLSVNDICITRGNLLQEYALLSEKYNCFTFWVCKITEYIWRTNRKVHFLKPTSAREGPCCGAV